MAGESVRIEAMGMMTPIGDSAAQTTSSARAGICRFQESSIYDKRFRPMTLALMPESALPPLALELEARPALTSRQRRMLRLSAPALREALDSAPKGIVLPLFLGVPEPDADCAAPIDEGFLEHLASQSGVPLDLDASRVFALGRAAGLHALDAAMTHLAGGNSHALVGGVDTHLDLRLLATLDAEERILAEGVMDGFVPGEGAGFLLLSNAPATEAAPAPRVHRPGLAEEEGHRYSELPYLGEGLARAVQAALEGAEGPPVRTVFASLNGENFGAKEWGVSYLRSSKSFAPELRIEHPADCFGDTGAAAGPLLIGLAAQGLLRGHVQGPCLVWCSSDRAPRAAARVTFDPTS